MLHRLDPALRHLAAARADLSVEVLGVVRESLNRRRAQTAAAVDLHGVDVTDVIVGRIPVRIYRAGSTPAPAVIYCHSGAFVLGNLDTDHLQCVEFARGGECTVISVDYRLAPEAPYPAGIDDAMAVLRWVVANSTELGIDPRRIAVAGSSAGGALAARLAQCAANGQAPAVVFQLLHQPVLDDRPTPSKEEFVDTPGFDGPAARQMWRYYTGDAVVPIDAVPSRGGELSGLVSTFISCSELDPLRDEAIQYATQLMRAGVPVELHVFPGTCHGFDSLIPTWEVSKQLFALQTAALRRALHPHD